MESQPASHPVTTSDAARAPLRLWERALLVFLLLLFVALGAHAVQRMAFLKRRMGDLGVYLRAAWAVQAGKDPYTVTCNNGWHYCYPPLLAIALVPLADAPAGEPPAGLVPYAVSAGLWYVLCVTCLFWGMHRLASAVEENSDQTRDQPRGCRRWWALRECPILWCAAAITSDLAKGQVNLLVLALLAGMTADLIRRRSLRAGLWLAGAICLKAIPAFLLLLPLWKRDWRCLGGCALGLVLGLMMIPTAVFGPVRAWELNRVFVQTVLAPGLGVTPDKIRDKELTGVNATDNQSLLALIHHNLSPEPAWRKPATPGMRLAFVALAALMTLITLLAIGARPARSATETALAVGALTLLMVLLSPVNHSHYFLLALPAVLGLLHMSWDSQPVPWPRPEVLIILAIFFLANLAIRAPGLEKVLKDRCLLTVATLPLWLTAVFWIHRLRAAALPQARDHIASGRTAA